MKENAVISYKSVASTAEAELVVKRSRFIGLAYPVASAQQAEDILAELHTVHPTARHICYAYKAGVDNEVVRSSDAGEPSGTAGRPILEVIEREGLRNTLVAVVRYFGGVLLGAGGLFRAYSAAAAAGVSAAGQTDYCLHQIYSVRTNYDMLGQIERVLATAGLSMENAEYTDNVIFQIAVPMSAAKMIKQQLINCCAGQISIQESATVYRQLS